VFKGTAEMAGEGGDVSMRYPASNRYSFLVFQNFGDQSGCVYQRRGRPPTVGADEASAPIDWPTAATLDSLKEKTTSNSFAPAELAQKEEASTRGLSSRKQKAPPFETKATNCFKPPNPGKGMFEGRRLSKSQYVREALDGKPSKKSEAEQKRTPLTQRRLSRAELP